MFKKFKINRAGIILIIFILLFITFIPASSAKMFERFGTVYTCEPVIDVTFDEEVAYSPLLPVDGKKEIAAYINCFIDGYYADEIGPYLEGNLLFCSIYLIDKPEWCTVAILPDKLAIPISIEGITANFTVSISIDEFAPAFSKEEIKIKLDVKGFSCILGGTFEDTISFIPGYLPVLDLDVPKNVQLTAPNEIANFDIKIKNLGNAKTNVTCDVLEVPEGWTAEITSNTVIGSAPLGENSEAKIRLSVRGPQNFGYHNEREVIKVSVTPSHHNDTSLSGPAYILSFIVQSKGFSTPGFETVFILFSLIIVFSIVNKRHKKNGKNNGCRRYK